MFGAIIENGASNWQIFQHTEGFAEISFSGRIPIEEVDKKSVVYICVRKEDTGDFIVWWEACEMDNDKWSHTLKLPVGGLYCIETCMKEAENEFIEWARRGDNRKHIGVGDLFIIAGQSNAAGFGKDFITDEPELGVHILKNSRKWDLASHPLQDNEHGEETPNMDSANTGNSMFISFAKYLKKELNYPIGLIQTSKGGANIDMWNTSLGGLLYDNMLDIIRLSGGKVAGMIWYQGCSDTSEDKMNNYYEKFTELKTRLENDIKMQDMPTILIQLARCYSKSNTSDDKGYAKIREALRQLGHNKNMYTIPATDSVMSDAIHVSAKSHLVLGERVAKSFLTHFYGKSYMCNAPEIATAKRISENEVCLTFDNVYYRIDAYEASPEYIAFTITDNDGENKIIDYTIKKDTIKIKCERKIQKCSNIHGAWDKNIFKIVPIDFATHLPMLSFYNFPIEY